MSKEGQNIKVVVRLRPFNLLDPNHGGQSCVVYNDKSLIVMVIHNNLDFQSPNEKNDFTFDHVFGADSTQE